MKLRNRMSLQSKSPAKRRAIVEYTGRPKFRRPSRTSTTPVPEPIPRIADLLIQVAAEKLEALWPVDITDEEINETDEVVAWVDERLAWYEGHKMSELKAMADVAGVKYTWRTRKPELIQRLIEAD